MWVKAQHEGALPPPCIVRKDPRVPHAPLIPRPSPTDSGGPGGRAGLRVATRLWRGSLPVSRGEGWSAEADAQEEERGPLGGPGDPGSAHPGPWAALGYGQRASGPVRLPFPTPHWPVSGGRPAVHTDQSGGGRPGRCKLPRKEQGPCRSQEALHAAQPSRPLAPRLQGHLSLGHPLGGAPWPPA